jgi:2-keto-4-pentenoate hydratase/2-oxohepta-3-ene-1,7-dioic acid hydratase in catechol pathway
MKIGRVVHEGAERFCVGEEGEDWILVSSLGVEVEDLPGLIGHLEEIQSRTSGGGGERIGGELRFECPVVRPSKVLGIGLNYMDHIRETGADPPDRPVVFAKYVNALTGPFDPIVVEPDLTEQADYEAELAVIIGRRGRRLTRDEALGHVLGYAVANDVSARDWQKRDAQFSRSKSMDTFCPIGPWITTADEVPDPQDLAIRSFVNGEPRQDSSTAEMLFGVSALIEFLSQTMTLEPGDVILTGTPHGVGFAMDPPRFLQPGDRVRCEVEGLGAIENVVVEEPEQRHG